MDADRKLFPATFSDDENGGLLFQHNWTDLDTEAWSDSFWYVKLLMLVDEVIALRVSMNEQTRKVDQLKTNKHQDNDSV